MLIAPAVMLVRVVVAGDPSLRPSMVYISLIMVYISLIFVRYRSVNSQTSSEEDDDSFELSDVALESVLALLCESALIELSLDWLSSDADDRLLALDWLDALETL